MKTGLTFQYFTYFLNPLEQVALFTDKRDKNEIFRELLSRKEVAYEGRGMKLAFVFVAQKNNYFVCKLGKRTSIKRNLPPDKKFEETHEENWPYCNVVINTNSDHGNGQKIAFEYKSNIFTSPHEQLKHFQDEMNTHLFSFGYVLSINPVTYEQKFWNIIDQNKDHIEELTFIFNTPNLFELENSLNDDLKDLQTKYSSTKVSLQLENPDGKLVVPRNPLTEQSVDYIARGGGEYSIKLKGRVKKVIKSKSNIETKTFDDLEIVINSGNQDGLFDILGKIFE